MIDQNELMTKWLTTETMKVSGELETTINIDIASYAINCCLYSFIQENTYRNVDSVNLKNETKIIYERLKTHPLFEYSVLLNLDNMIEIMKPIIPFRRSSYRIVNHPDDLSVLFDSVFFDGASEYVKDSINPIISKLKLDYNNKVESLLDGNNDNKKLLGLV